MGSSPRQRSQQPHPHRAVPSRGAISSSVPRPDPRVHLSSSPLPSGIWDSCRPTSLPEPEATRLPRPPFPPSSFCLRRTDAFWRRRRGSARRWDRGRGRSCRGCRAVPAISHPVPLSVPWAPPPRSAAREGRGAPAGCGRTRGVPFRPASAGRPRWGCRTQPGPGGASLSRLRSFGSAAPRPSPPGVPLRPRRAVPSARLSAGGSPRSTARRGPGAAPERPERSGAAPAASRGWGGAAGSGGAAINGAGSKRRCPGGAGRGRAAPCGSARAAAAARPLPARRRRLKGRRERRAPPASAEGRGRRASTRGPGGRGRCPFKARAAGAGGFIYMGARGCHVTGGAAAPGGG